MPTLGRDLDSRVSSTSLFERTVSPSNNGCGSRTSSHPRLATALTVRSVTDCPVTSASVKHELTSGRLNSVALAYSVSKWIGLVFIVRQVNQTLSAAITVRPSGCS